MILSVNHIHKSYGKEQILKDISFTIAEPQIIALVGPNGSGKSTLLNIIANIVRADRGEVTVLNKSNRDPNIFREMSYLQDNSVLYDYLTGYDHLQFIGDIQSISKTEIDMTANTIGITGYLHKKVGNYSLGMKQHLLLAMAILNKPKLLVLDEPLNGLDPTSAIKIRNLLIKLHKEGTAILLSSHQLAEVDRVTSNILFLKNGRLIKEDLSHEQNVTYVLTVDQPLNAQTALESHQVNVKAVEENKLVIPMNETSFNKVFEILNNQQITVHDMEKKKLGSEDRYQMIFGKREVT